MIVNPENWHYGYSQIQTDCRANDDGVAGSVLILSNADADAMCGARILSYMLRSDGISYHLLPCMSYSYMQKVLARKKADDVRAVVLLNIGASRNLTRLFDAVNTEEDQEESLLDPSTKIYVMDCRRPVHLANIHAGENVVVFWDGPAQNEDIPSDGDNLSGDDSSSSSEEEGDDDDSSSDGEEEFDEDLDEEGEENEFGGDGAQNHMQVDIEDDQNISKKDEHESDYDADKDEDDGDNGSKMMVGDDINGDDRSKDGSDNDVNENGDDSGSQQQQEEDHEQNQLPTLTPREMHNERRNRLRAYYSSGSFHGSPAAYVAYKVSTQLRFNEIGDLLWLACVGVTDAYLHSRLDVSGYAELAMFLRLRATSLFPNDMYHRVENTAYAEHLTGVGSDRRSNSQNLTKIGFSENGRILSESDYRFFLLRHTTLYKAMICSDFVSTRLQLHTKRGRERLQEFLAKIGMSLEECNQPFAFMKPGLIRRLPKQMREHAEEYNLQNFEYTGFFRVTGFRSLLSAADTSSAVTALLECDRPREISTTDESGIDDDREEAELLQSFNYAYDALNPNESGEGNSQGNLVNGGNLTGGTGLGAGIKLGKPTNIFDLCGMALHKQLHDLNLSSTLHFNSDGCPRKYN